MKAEERREKLIRMLEGSSAQPVPGDRLAKALGVSRQVIVQDVALLRERSFEILSTNHGYVLHGKLGIRKVFKVVHSDEQIEEELNLIVDSGGCVEDVFVYHKMYGVIRAEMGIRSRRDVRRYLEGIRSGKSSPLMNVTSGYHYHTVSADTQDCLDEIMEGLRAKGFLAELKAYEPVEF